MSNDQSIPSEIPKNANGLEDLVWRLAGDILVMRATILNLFDTHQPCQQTIMLERLQHEIQQQLTLLNNQAEKRLSEGFHDSATSLLESLHARLKRNASSSSPEGSA